MKHLVFASALASVVVLPGVPAPREEPRTVAPAKAEPLDCFARRTRKLTDRVWVIERPNPTDAPFEGNTTVIELDRSLVVVDAGGSRAAGESIVREIRALSRKPVGTLVYTHYHGDHNLGAVALRDAWPDMAIVSTERTREHMTGAPMDYVRSYAKSYGEMAAFALRQSRDESVSASERAGWARFAAAGPCMESGYTDPVVVPAQVTFSERYTIHDASMQVEVLFLGRANTDGDALVWLPGQRVLVTGDVVVHPIPYASACHPGEWCTVLERVKGFDFAFLVPGHGAVQTDRAYVDTLLEALREIRGRVGELAGRGMELDEVRRTVDLKSVRARFVGDEDGWGRVLFANLFLEAIVANAWREARGEPIVQGREGG
ncbi:MAG: MBL fold metallo-hydrolase [Planctomycetota bacterium]|nr:MBL fold metallo-hydrolase [Planctomycetota bacterium]